MPRYLDVPLWDSEEQDMQQQAVAYCVRLAEKVMALAEQIAEAVDQYPYHWGPDDLLPLEQVLSDLEHAVAAMKRADLIEEKAK